MTFVKSKFEKKSKKLIILFSEGTQKELRSISSRHWPL